MKRTAFILLALAVSVPFASAQNNPLGIDDTCYAFYREAERYLGKTEFPAANDLLYQSAKEKGDEKAHVLYYVEALKHLSCLPGSEENDLAVDNAQEILKKEASEHGHRQYFYQSYNIVQKYYYRRNKPYRAMLLLQDMQEDALENNDAYGIWTASKYLASLYINQNDYVSAKPHLEQALYIYNNSTDESISAESPTRLYCDLADTYPIASDSVRINVEKGTKAAKLGLDSLRCHYYLARLAALNGNLKEYQRLKDLCLGNPSFSQITPDSELFFSLIDSAHDGSILQREDDIFRLSSVRQMKVIANICENRGYKDFAFGLEKELVRIMEKELSKTNQSRISELDVTMGKAALNAELDAKEHLLSNIMKLVLGLVIAILGVVAIFLLMHVRNLKKAKEKDAKQIQELQEANEKVKLADAAKTRFVQNMSHEVRTPLNAIVGFSQLLSLPDGTLAPEEKEEFAGHIVNNTKMLTMLLDDILNTSSMDNGSYRISYEEGEKDFMCQSAISSAEHRLQPGVKMYYQPEEDEHFTFTTDPRRVQQILINLLTNACKHTSAGEIKLTSSLAEYQGFVTFAVTDTGPGVPAEDAEKIFERFTKLNQFVQGTGLGLSICRDIAGRMGAEVFLDKTHTGPGARFVFKVPVEPPAQA